MPNRPRARTRLQSIASVLLLLVILAAIGQRLASQEPSKPKMTDDQIVSGWKNEKVVLIGKPAVSKLIGDIATVKCHNCPSWELPCYRRAEKPEEGLASETYAGKSGVIVETKIISTLPLPPGQLLDYELEIVLDGSGEKIAACSGDSLGFVSEFEAASKLAGKPFWAKGNLDLSKGSDLQKPRAERDTLEVTNTRKLTLTRAVWGDPDQTVELCFNTESGEEGCLDSGPNHYRVDPRFHFSWDSWPYTDLLYSEDPHKLFPRWSKAMWELIERQEVAIGMTEKMAIVACGGRWVEEGAVVATGSAVSHIYSCQGKRFLIQNGKVSKYVESR